MHPFPSMRRSVRGPCDQVRDRAHIPSRGILLYLRIIYPRRVCANRENAIRSSEAERRGGEVRSKAARREVRRLQPGAHSNRARTRRRARLDTRQLRRASIGGASSPAPRPRQRPGTTRGQRRPRSSGRHRRAPRADPRNHARPRRLRFGDTHRPHAS